MRWTYRPELDGLRTIAVYLVLLFHTGLSWVEGGFVGVDLFFVLSGFLVSNVILSEIDRTGSLRVGNFYARRVRRLLPAAVVVILATSLIFRAGGTGRPPAADGRGRAELAALLRQLALPLRSRATTSPPTSTSSPFLHFWSLSIEEQFYLFFPLLLLVLIKVAKRLTLVAHRHPRHHHRCAPSRPRWPHSSTGPRSTPPAPTTAPTLGSTSCSPAPCSPCCCAADPSPSRARVGGAAAGIGLVGILVVGSGLLDVGPSARGLLATVVSVLAIGGLTLVRAVVVGPAALPPDPGLPRQDLLRHLPLALAGHPGARRGPRREPDRGRGDDDGSRHRPGRGVVRSDRDADPEGPADRPAALDPGRHRRRDQRSGRDDPRALGARVRAQARARRPAGSSPAREPTSGPRSR